MNKIKKICLSLLIRACRFTPDRFFLRTNCHLRLGYKPDLEAPSTFSEKLQWLKLNYRNPAFPDMVDKYKVKAFVAERLGEQYVIPTYGVWDNVDSIDIDSLPESFILKCTHDSGGNVICRDKSRLDIRSAKSKLKKCLAYDFYYLGREWPYRSVERKVLAERLLVSDDGEDLKDYKFFCFNGVVKCFKVDLDRFSCHRSNYYDTDGNLLEIGEKYYPPLPDRKVVLPSNLAEMIRAAETLSEGIPFVRVDMYNVAGHIYFSEMTFFPAGGFLPYTSYAADLQLGNWLDLPEKNV